MQELLAFFRGLSDKSGTEGRLKICLGSRPEPLIDLALRACPGFRMQDWNLGGIEQYVSKTVVGWKNNATDKQTLEQLCAEIPKRAEGIFLWARFAVSKVVESDAKGDAFSESKQRLDELPSNMEGIYARIFSRMSMNDRDEARLMFQLVSSATKTGYERGTSSPALTILQLKEAIDVAKNRTADSMHEDGVNSLERFRKRTRAKCGGLLEETPTETTSPISKDDRKMWNIKLIHRTVRSYLKQQGWLSGWKIGNESFASPHALWLYICCKCVQSMWASSASPLP